MGGVCAMLLILCICLYMSDAQNLLMTEQMEEAQLRQGTQPGMENTEMINARVVLGRCNDRCYKINDYCKDICEVCNILYQSDIVFVCLT